MNLLIVIYLDVVDYLFSRKKKQNFVLQEKNKRESNKMVNLIIIVVVKNVIEFLFKKYTLLTARPLSADYTCHVRQTISIPSSSVLRILFSICRS